MSIEEILVPYFHYSARLKKKFVMPYRPGASENRLSLADTLNIAPSCRSVLPQSATRHADYLPLLLLAAIW